MRNDQPEGVSPKPCMKIIACVFILGVEEGEESVRDAV